MSFKRFSDDCPGCRPALLDLETGTPVPDNAPMMQAILGVWAQTTRSEREVFHRVTCRDSRVPSDLRIFQDIGQRMQTALKALEERTITESRGAQAN